jgi:hypothetical protein
MPYFIFPSASTVIQAKADLFHQVEDRAELAEAPQANAPVIAADRLDVVSL